MKKLNYRFLLFLLMLVYSIGALAQHVTDVEGHPNIKKLKYKYYTSYFSIKDHIPVLVTYTLTKKMISCDKEHKVPRSNKFKPDPQFKEETNLQKDYTRSGYDRGHNMNAADNACNKTGMDECFYFSNMTPQPHSFNAGVWEDLENQERTLAEDHDMIIVSIGSIGKATTIGDDEVVVPKWMWKVIYIPETKEYQAYIFHDTDDNDNALNKYKTTKAHIEDAADVTFESGTAVLN